MAIQITEYSYSSANGEFVEFTNTGTTAVDMTGYSFDDVSRIAGSFSLSAFGTVKAGESVIITETVDVNAFRTAWGLPATVKVIGGSNLQQTTGDGQGLGRADEINLYDNNKVLVDRLTYDDATITGSPRTQNISASTTPANLGKNDPTKWTLSAVSDAQGSKTSVTGGDIGNPGSYLTAAARVTLEGIDLSKYTRIGRYDLPEPTRTTPPTGSLLAQEVSAVTYNPDTDTLFVVGDGGTSIVQVSKTGALINSMTLAAGASPQGTDFYDLEGIAYIGGGKFVMTEERDRQVVQFTYAPGTTLTRTTAGTSTVKLGTTIGNIGLEGITYDPQTSGYVLVKEATPEGIFQTTIDFTAKTASNGSPTTVNSIDLFNPALLGVTDIADVYSLSNVTALNGKADSSHLLVLSQESGKIVNVDRTGKIFSTLTIAADATDTISVADQSHEGVTVDKDGILYVVSENGGGNVDRPQLWVYAPSTATPVNQAPTAVTFGNPVLSIADKTSTTARVKVADITVTDDGLGTNNLTLTGTDAAAFEIFSNGLYVKAGTAIDFKTKANYSVTVNVDDPTVGATPDLTKAFTLAVTDPNAIPTIGSIFVTEVAPWSSGNSPIGADWFELTNNSKAAINIAGWKFDDNSNSFAAAATLDGITSIGAGESVVFVDVQTVAAASDAFKTNWFGANVPAGFRIGTYNGVGSGLSTGGDAVNIYNAVGDLQANVVFGVSPATTPFATFNNAALLNNTTISELSAVGVNGAVSIVDSLSNTEIGSPGKIGAVVAAPVNKAPTAVLLTNLVDRLAENSSSTARVRVADIAVTDDALGTNTLSLAGTDASAFEIFNNALYVKAGTNLDYETKNSYSVSVNVDDTTVGVTPDATKTFILSLTDVVEPTLFSGVAAGDATTNNAILWTRTYDSTYKKAVNTNLTAEVSTDAGFSKIAFTYKAPARTDGLNHDGTLKIEATGLTSGTKYYYRFKTDAGDISQIGTFKTAVAADVKTAVRFGFSGDYDGLMRPYSSTADFGKLNLDFFGNVGDTIYETASKFSPLATDPNVNVAQALIDYHGKYLESFLPTTPGGFASLQTLFASQGNYTQLDNHELGNKQLINGGAPAILAPLAGNGTNNTAYDVNKTGTFINQTVPFKTLIQAYTDYQPIKEKLVVAPGDARSNGTQQLYNSQQWGANVLYINTDTRSYRDVRLKTTDAAGNITTTDDTGARADNPDRTLFGKTQLAWVKQNLLDAQKNGVTWKFVAIADAIDQLGAIGSGADNGKTWFGGYRAERNELLKFIADNGIKNVVFLSCDDHQNRINELTYLDNINDPTSIRVLPNAIAVVDGPIGATGPDAITDHSFANIKALADKLAATQAAAGINPIGLDPNLAGLRNVVREGDPNANTLRQAADFYSPDTFNYTTFDISADGKTLNVNVQGINSYAKDTNPEPSAANPIRSILSFSLDAAAIPTVAAGTSGEDTIVPTTLQTIFTDGGNDKVDGSVGGGSNRIYGGDGNDELLAGKNDRLFGEAGDDTLDAVPGKGGNRLYGGDGNDILFAGSNDFLSGGDGNDILYAGKGGNTLYGGAGTDKFYLAYNGAPTSTNTVADFEAGIDKLLILGISGVSDFSKVTLTAKGADTLVAAGGKDLALLTGIGSSTLNASSFAFA